MGTPAPDHWGWRQACDTIPVGTSHLCLEWHRVSTPIRNQPHLAVRQQHLTGLSGLLSLSVLTALEPVLLDPEKHQLQSRTEKKTWFLAVGPTLPGGSSPVPRERGASGLGGTASCSSGNPCGDLGTSVHESRWALSPSFATSQLSDLGKVTSPLQASFNLQTGLMVPNPQGNLKSP